MTVGVASAAAVVAVVGVAAADADAVAVGAGAGAGAEPPSLRVVDRVLDTDSSRSSPLMSLCVVEYCRRGS